MSQYVIGLAVKVFVYYNIQLSVDILCTLVYNGIVEKYISDVPGRGENSVVVLQKTVFVNGAKGHKQALFTAERF